MVDLDVEGSLRQLDLLLAYVRRHTGPNATPFNLTPEILIDLHWSMWLHGQGVRRGFRTGAVRVGQHAPIAPHEVEKEVRSFCDYVNNKWTDADAIDLSAYALWMLNWIHPFEEGNGRTARALSYMILSIKLGFELPGFPTIPEQLMLNLPRYYDALARADDAYQNGKIDISALSELLEEMLIRQIDLEPALDSDLQGAISDVVERRIRTGSPSALSSSFGTSDVEWRLWSLGEYVVLQVGSASAISAAERMLASQGSPFPHLLAPEDEEASLEFGESDQGAIVTRNAIGTGSGYAIKLAPGAAIIIARPKPPPGDKGEEIAGVASDLSGVLYVIRYGEKLTGSRLAETLDFLVTRHLAVAI